jgi:TPR repeat protein
MKRLKLLLIMALLIGFAAVAHAGLDDGKAAHKRGDYATAYREFKEAAEQGDAEAQTCLAIMYEYGRGIPQDHAEARKWYRTAAEQGDVNAQCELGMMYEYGKRVGFPQDYAEARKWYLMAAEQGDEQAQYSLGVMYQDGEGLPQDYVQAHMWLNLAAAHGGLAVQKIRDDLAKLMTPAQIAEAQRIAREWKPKGQE